LVSSRCISCHTLERVYRYNGSDWDRVVGRMKAYGTRLTESDYAKIVAYLEGHEDQKTEEK
jgi:mono/diheme cytochrome c family protein